jgi:hypothetical protein
MLYRRNVQLVETLFKGSHMPNLTQAREYLTIADRYIEQAEEQIDKQIAKNAKLDLAGLDTKPGYKFLALHLEFLELMQQHRKQILDALYEEESGAKR